MGDNTGEMAVLPSIDFSEVIPGGDFGGWGRGRRVNVEDVSLTKMVSHILICVIDLPH